MSSQQSFFSSTGFSVTLCVDHIVPAESYDTYYVQFMTSINASQTCLLQMTRTALSFESINDVIRCFPCSITSPFKRSFKNTQLCLMMTSPSVEESSVFHYKNISSVFVEEIHIPLEFRKKKPDITTEQWNTLERIVKDLEDIHLEPLSDTSRKCVISINSPNSQQLLATMMKLNIRLREAELMEVVFFKTLTDL